MCLRNGRDSMIVKATYAIALADAPAIKEMKGSKGHSGKKPCIRCKYILGRVGSFDDFVPGYCRHYLEPDHRTFDLHDRGSFNQVAVDL